MILAKKPCVPSNLHKMFYSSYNHVNMWLESREQRSFSMFSTEESNLAEHTYVQCTSYICVVRSTVLNFGSCPIQHVTYLKLLLEAEQMHKLTSIFHTIWSMLLF